MSNVNTSPLTKWASDRTTTNTMEFSPSRTTLEEVADALLRMLNANYVSIGYERDNNYYSMTVTTKGDDSDE